MISIYKTVEEEMVTLDKIEEGCWVSVIHPNEEELAFLQEETGIDMDDLRAPLDDEERSRIELEDQYNMILVDIPSLDEKDRYVTIPLGIYMTKEHIITICLEETPVLKAFANRRVREFYTFKKTRFVFQILYRNAASYLRYLRIIDRKSDQIEEKLHISQKNSELIELLELEKSLVYFTTSLRSNEVVLEKLLRTERVRKYPEDEDLLEDVIIENKQAREMVEMYSKILARLADTFSSIISNNLNQVMKFLAAITILLAIPTVISSFFGMNVPVPMSESPYAFTYIFVIAGIVAGICGILLWKRDMF